MRISDWSSDVCSSDLKAQTYVDISRLLDAVMGHFGQIPEGRPNGFHLGPKAAWKGTQPSRRALWPELDRKSVASGKSVAVRVDLGGRRIIKKKKNKITNTNIPITQINNRQNTK